jgi:hypothetical protein
MLCRMVECVIDAGVFDIRKQVSDYSYPHGNLRKIWISNYMILQTFSV